MIKITEHIQKLRLVQLFEAARRFEEEGQEPFGVRINYDQLNKTHPQFLPDYDFASVDDPDGLYRFVEYQDQYYSWYTEANYHHLGDELSCLHPFTANDFEPVNRGSTTRYSTTVSNTPVTETTWPLPVDSTEKNR